MGKFFNDFDTFGRLPCQIPINLSFTLFGTRSVNLYNQAVWCFGTIEENLFDSLLTEERMFIHQHGLS